MDWILSLVKNLNPDDYSSPEAKSVIWKVKSIRQNDTYKIRP